MSIPEETLSVTGIYRMVELGWESRMALKFYADKIKRQLANTNIIWGYLYKNKINT